MIRQNLGKRDRFLWIVIGIIFIVVSIYKLNWWFWQFIFAIAGVMLIISGITGFSIIYSLLGHSSRGYGIDRITKRDIERAVKEYGLKTQSIVEVKPSKVSKKVVKKAKKKTTKKISKKTTKKAVKKTPKKTVKKSAKKATKKTAKKATKKVVNK